MREPDKGRVPPLENSSGINSRQGDSFSLNGVRSMPQEEGKSRKYPLKRMHRKHDMDLACRVISAMREKGRLLLGFCSFAILLIFWGAASYFSDWSGQVFPDPITVIKSLWELCASGTLLRHATASLYRVTVGFYLAVALGIPVGVVLGRLKTVRALVNPIIQFLRPISPLAWIPMAMLWFGIGDPPAIFLIFMASFFPMAVSTTIAVANINPTFFQVAANFNFSRWETITKLILPAIIPEVVTALRMTVTIAWLVVVAAEMIAVQSGLGYLILDARNALRMDFVMDGMIVIGFIGLILDYLMKRLSRIESTRWKSMSG